MEMSTDEAAECLGVTPRQVQRLVATGTLTATGRFGRALMIDVSSVNQIMGKPRRQGKPWPAGMAWAALWRLSGLGTPWIDARFSRRLDQYLTDARPGELGWLCRRRAVTSRYRASGSFLPTLRSNTRLTGVSALDMSRDTMAPSDTSVDRYVTTDEQSALVDAFSLSDAAGANVTLRATDFPVVVSWPGVMPVAVVAVDLMDSRDIREAAAGQHILQDLLA